jgi:hypothetical protein
MRLYETPNEQQYGEESKCSRDPKLDRLEIKATEGRKEDYIDQDQHGYA